MTGLQPFAPAAVALIALLNSAVPVVGLLMGRAADQWQKIVRMRIHDNLTFQQIAEHLGIPLGTALTRMRRALERMRTEIEQNES